MENNKTPKKANAIKKIGKTIKDTFVEMSNSLAGWIDDTSAQFSGKKPAKKITTAITTTVQQKTSGSQTKRKS